MTEDERRNRNPKMEVVRTTRAEIEAMPAVGVADLEMHRVYVVQSEKHITTLNYLGATHLFDVQVMDVVRVHHFHGPRVGMDIYLAARPDGSWRDAVGTRITVRKWTGEDA